MLITDFKTRPWPRLESFLMGGFEGATHRRHDRLQIDVANTTGHNLYAKQDYGLLTQAGITTVRDSLRWHLVEKTPHVYDWSSLSPLMEAAVAGGTQVIWDLCHWGYPKHLDIFSHDFVVAFASFACAADQVLRKNNQRYGDDAPLLYCPINEMSFWAWVGGDEQHFDPYGAGRGPELKLQLAKASIAATRAIRRQNPKARFVQAEPIIHITAEDEEDKVSVARHTESQFEAWDLLAGRGGEHAGGSEDILDIIGVNYYWNNQWIHEGDRTPPGHEGHKPLHQMLENIWKRYDRPILITETGVECGPEFGWLGYVASEIRQAHRLGVPVLGICIYPVMDYPGWDDDRHCECGLIQVSDDWTTRTIREDFREELQLQGELLQSSFLNTFAQSHSRRDDAEALHDPLETISAS